jgi:hypothetical protein
MEEDVKQHNHPSPGDASSTSNRWIQAVILVEVDGPSDLSSAAIARTCSCLVGGPNAAVAVRIMCPTKSDIQRIALVLLSFATACGGGGTAGGAQYGGSGGTGGAGGAGGAGTVSAGNPVNLGTAKNYAILAESGISTVPTSAITGNLGISPAAATFITGFSLVADSTNVFSTSPQVTGKVYAADYAVPTPSVLTAAIADMQLAFTDAAGRAPGATELGAGSIGGMNLAPGVYQWGTGLLIPTDITLTGTASDVWIFQVAKNLTMSSGTKILLAGGAQSKNIFWQVAGLVDLGTTAHCEGVILTQTSVTLRTGASINGRLLAQTAVNLDGSSVVEPAQ